MVGGYFIAAALVTADTYAFAIKFTSTGEVDWSWKASMVGVANAAIQLPSTSHIVVAGWCKIKGVGYRCLTQLDATTGAENWVASSFGDSKGSNGAYEMIDLSS